MALPNPSTAWRLARFLLREAAYALPAGIAYIEDQLVGHEAVSNLGWMKITQEFTRLTPTGTEEDRAMLSFHVVNITGGAVDTTWTAGDFTTVKNAMTAWNTSILPLLWSSTNVATMKVYDMAFDPSDPGPLARAGSGLSQFRDTGPPVYRWEYNMNGAGGAPHPYQSGSTCTFRTALPKHWGRAYLPGHGTLDAWGRLSASNCILLADAWHDLGAQLAAGDFLHVVPIGQVNKQAFHGLLGVDQYVVDDIPDIQRRRRPKQAKIHQVGA